MPTPLRVLLIEDSEDDAALLLRELRRGGYEADWQRVDTAPALLEALAAREWDVITCDYVMPQFSATAALKYLRDSGLDLPIIIVSGQVGEEVAVTAMKAGAHDYISKHRMARLVPAINREMAEAASRRARREAEATLRASEEKYRDLVEALHDVVFEVDAAGTIMHISPGIEALSGFPAAEVIGQPFTDFIHPDDLATVLASLAKTARGHGAPAEFRVADRGGAQHWVRTMSRPVVNAEGTLRGLRGVLTDITARREAEDAYRTVFEHSLLGLAVAQGDRIVLANPALAALSGWDLDDIIGQPVTGLTYGMLHPQDLPRMLEAAQSFGERGELQDGFDFRVVRRDGAVRRVITTHTDFRYRGAPARLIAYADVTDRWQAEAAYRGVFEQSLLGLVVVHQDGTYAMANPAFVEMVGIASEELLQLDAQQVNDRFVHPDDREALDRALAGWRDHGQPAPPFEYRLVRPDGDVRHLHCRATRIELEKGPAVLCAVADVTERRRAEATYRAIFELSGQGLLLVQNGRYMMANQALADLVGIAPEEILAMPVHEARARVIHADDHAAVTAHVRHFLKTATLPPPFELRVLRADGTERTVLCHPARIGLEGADAVLVSFVDMTERRRAEEAYRAIFHHSIQGMILAQRDRIIMANPAVSEITGFRLDELLGLPLQELTRRLVHSEELPQMLPLLERWIGAGVSPERYTFRVRRPDGTEGALYVQSSRLMHEGEPALLVAIADLTDRWRAEEAYRGVFEHSLQGLMVVCEGRVVMANQAMHELTGYSTSELTELRIEALIERLLHPDDLADLRRDLRARATNVVVGVDRRELRIARKDGSARHVLAQTSMTSFAGKPALLVAQVDVTDRAYAEAALRTLNAELEGRVSERTAQLEAAARELETFSYSVSHDLRAPLRAIDGFTRSVLDDYGPQLPVAAARDLERVRGAARRMSELIERLLALSRVARVEMRRTPVDLSALAREIVDELAGGEPARRVAVAIAEGLRAHGDAALLRALFGNLLANAWKFTARSGAARVEVGAVHSDGTDGPAFFVRDNGVGFEMRDADQLFRAFHRLHSASEFDGHGIGLATVQRVVQRHGGRVWAEAAVDLGATFYFTLG